MYFELLLSVPRADPVLVHWARLMFYLSRTQKITKLKGWPHIKDTLSQLPPYMNSTCMYKYESKALYVGSTNLKKASLQCSMVGHDSIPLKLLLLSNYSS